MRTNTRRMHKLRDDFFAEGTLLAARGDPEADCWLCKQAIDYSLPAGTVDESHELDHYFPVRDYPELQEDPTNFRHSHRACNVGRNRTTQTGDLGPPVADWW